MTFWNWVLSPSLGEWEQFSHIGGYANPGRLRRLRPPRASMETVKWEREELTKDTWLSDHRLIAPDESDVAIEEASPSATIQEEEEVIVLEIEDPGSPIEVPPLRTRRVRSRIPIMVTVPP